MKKHAIFVMGLFLLLALISPCSAEEIKHTVVKGDTLWDISMKYLKTPWKWPLVWANNEDITNPHLIYPGDVVVITQEAGKTIIKIIPSPDRGGTESKMTIAEVAAVKGKSILVSPQSATFIYSPTSLTGSGTVVKKIEGGELISQNDHIVIKSASAVSPNQAITIVSKVQEVTKAGNTVGYLYKAVATAVVEEVQSDVVKARIVYSLQEAKVGDIFFDNLDPVKPLTLSLSESALQAPAQVIDFFGGVQGCSFNDLVFIDAGKNQGVDKGMILNIAKRTTFEDEKKKEEVAVFHDYAGLAVVLQSLEDSSMCLMVESKIQIEKGDVVEGKK